MGKLKVGHKFELPEGFELIQEIGGYLIASMDNHAYICGKTIYDLSKAPIMLATIIPVTAERINELNVLVGDGNENLDLTGYAFEYDDKVVYYMVAYGVDHPEASGTFVFDNLDDAILLQGIMVDFKGQSLKFEMGLHE